MFKNLLILLLFGLCIFSTYVAVRNSKPVCEDLQRQGDDLVCIYNLGEIAEDQADVIIIRSN